MENPEGFPKVNKKKATDWAKPQSVAEASPEGNQDTPLPILHPLIGETQFIDRSGGTDPFRILPELFNPSVLHLYFEIHGFKGNSN